MERLQEALSRARVRRQQAGTVERDARPAPADGPARRRAPQSDDDAARIAAWQKIAPFEVNERLLRANRVVSYFGGREAAPIDMMRTKILQQVKANNWRRIVVTSPSAKCGKTTLAANLAFSFARQPELRTLAIEIDMRRPEMANLLGVKGNLAFARYLAGSEPAEPHLRTHGDNLAFGMNRAPTPNPSELLHSAFARERLEALEATLRPDLVLFDSPPILSSDDTVGFLDFADAALIVAAAEMTSIDEIDVTETEVAAATNVLGVVLNKTRYGGTGYGYDEGYY